MDRLHHGLRHRAGRIRDARISRDGGAEVSEVAMMQQTDAPMHAAAGWRDSRTNKGPTARLP
jgi:hypothetical protein